MNALSIGNELVLLLSTILGVLAFAMASVKPPQGVPAAFSERRFKYVKLMMDTAAGWDIGNWSWEPSDDLYLANVECGIFPIGVREDCEAGVQLGRGPLYVSMYRQVIKATMDIHANLIFEYWTKP